MENLQLVQACECLCNCGDDSFLADLANTLEQRSSGPTKKEEVSKNMTIIVVWQGQIR